jgi:hypothetical protein
VEEEFAMRSLVALLALMSVGLVGCQKSNAFKLYDTQEEQDVAADELPTKALATLGTVATPHPVTEFEREIRGGETYYEGEWMTPAGEHEATVATSGALIEQAVDIDAADVPEAVRATAAAELDDPVEIEYEQRMFVIYEVEAVTGDDEDGEERVLLISPTGKVLLRK